MSLKLQYTSHAHCTNYPPTQFIYAIKVFPMTSLRIKWCFLLWLVCCITQFIVPKIRIKFRKRIREFPIPIYVFMKICPLTYVIAIKSGISFSILRHFYVIDCYFNIANLSNYQVTQISITYKQIFHVFTKRPISSVIFAITGISVCTLASL